MIAEKKICTLIGFYHVAIKQLDYELEISICGMKLYSNKYAKSNPRLIRLSRNILL